METTMIAADSLQHVNSTVCVRFTRLLVSVWPAFMDFFSVMVFWYMSWFRWTVMQWEGAITRVFHFVLSLWSLFVQRLASAWCSVDW